MGNILNKVLLLFLFGHSGWLLASESLVERGKVLSQLLYVPIYSEIPYGDRNLTLNLTATLAIRNLDQSASLTLTRVDYYDAKGALVRGYLSKPLVIGPMSSIDYVVGESDRSGGVSASFLVEWQSKAPINAPYVEAVMVNITYNKAVAFTGAAQILKAE